jgi:hypothetical protein
MAFELTQDKHSLSLPAASDILPYSVLSIVGTSAAGFITAASNNVRPFGANRNATYLRTEYAAGWHDGNIMKLKAAASVGAGAAVAVASANGAVGPAAAASGVARWEVGTTLSPAAAGEIVSVFINPRQTGALA